MAARQKIYWKNGRIPLDTVWLDKHYLPLTYKQFLKSELAIIPGLLDRQEEAQFPTECGLQLNRDKPYHLMNQERVYTSFFKYPLNGWYCVSVAAPCFQMYVCKWISRHYECCVIYSRNEDDLFSRIGQRDGLDVVADSHEKTIDMQADVVR